jgi:hypothetical protein
MTNLDSATKAAQVVVNISPICLDSTARCQPRTRAALGTIEGVGDQTVLEAAIRLPAEAVEIGLSNHACNLDLLRYELIKRTPARDHG